MLWHSGQVLKHTTLCSRRREDIAVDPFVQTLSASPCSQNVNMQDVKEMGKSYLSLLLRSFRIDPINIRRAAWSSLVLQLCTLVPEQSARPDTITHANEIIITFTQDWNRTFLNISLLRNPSSFHLQPQKCLHARRQSGWRGDVICGIWEWPHKTCHLTKLGLTLLVVLSCYVASEHLRLALAGFLYKPLF